MVSLIRIIPEVVLSWINLKNGLNYLGELDPAALQEALLTSPGIIPIREWTAAGAELPLDRWVCVHPTAGALKGPGRSPV